VIDLLLLSLSAAVLIAAAGQGSWVGYPLLLTLALFCLRYWLAGWPLPALAAMMRAGVAKSSGVLTILLLIGVLIAAWMAAGTVPALVYYGLQLIQPRLFVLSTFSLTALVSLLIGTSFGAAGTIGVALMIMARGSSLNLDLVAGAIIAGAYVGDRCSPMSSSAHLIATLTGTDLYRNLRAMLTSSAVPLALTLVIYWRLSWQNPLSSTETPIGPALAASFSLHPAVLLPAIAVLLLAGLRVPVKRTMAISLGLAVGLSLWLQGYSGLALAELLLCGFKIESSPVLAPLLQSGGLLPMARICLVVVISTALSGLLSGTQSLRQLSQPLANLRGQRSLFLGTIGISLLTAAYGCTQTLAILLTQTLMLPHYQQAQMSPEQLALDLENTAVVLAPLVPWNIAGLVPAALLMSDAGFVPYAVYLYLVPLFSLLAWRPAAFWGASRP
jgi:Na+:H+ antiporter, NhaC family